MLHFHSFFMISKQEDPKDFSADEKDKMGGLIGNVLEDLPEKPNLTRQSSHNINHEEEQEVTISVQRTPLGKEPLIDLLDQFPDQIRDILVNFVPSK